MGRGEGEGCYCPINAFLTHIIDRLSKNYDITLIDMEAGMEHLSRRTDRDVDIMIVVTDPSSMGLQTARRVREVAKEVRIEFRKMFLIGNRFKPDMGDQYRMEAKSIGYEFAGSIPNDDDVFSYNLRGKPLLNLSSNNPAVVAVEQILKRIGLLA
jgi:CO dehydrogenase maturation factor